mmetsp:Transcript_11357/g.30377  ORF Transcript_11357/g.30377 Transcript_11357/m.30377 type:complete len:208 (+) Transcript_11357:553-1176(+)
MVHGGKVPTMPAVPRAAAARPHISMMACRARIAAAPFGAASMKTATDTSPSQAANCASNRSNRSSEHCVTRHMGEGGPSHSVRNKTSRGSGSGPTRPRTASRAATSAARIFSANHWPRSSRGGKGRHCSRALEPPSGGGPPPGRSSSPPAYIATTPAVSSTSSAATPASSSAAAALNAESSPNSPVGSANAPASAGSMGSPGKCSSM